MTIIIKVGETEKLRFEPHLVGEDFVITPRRGRRFPIPIGSNVWNGDEFLGVVTFMVPEQFQRCRVMFEPVVVEPPDEVERSEAERIGEAQQRLDETTQEEWEAMREERDAVVSAECGDVPEAGSIAELELSDRLLDILGSHGLGRLLALRSALSRGDEFMLALGGIGPKSLAQIRGALVAWEFVERSSASPDG